MLDSFKSLTSSEWTLYWLFCFCTETSWSWWICWRLRSGGSILIIRWSKPLVKMLQSACVEGNIAEVLSANQNNSQLQRSSCFYCLERRTGVCSLQFNHLAQKTWLKAPKSSHFFHRVIHSVAVLYSIPHPEIHLSQSQKRRKRYGVKMGRSSCAWCSNLGFASLWSCRLGRKYSSHRGCS